MPTGAVTLAEIQSADWSLMLDSSSGTGQAGDGIGSVVQGLDDINQCIGIILATPKGTDPLRPEFASDLWQWIDVPINVARPQLVKEVWDAVTRWEPRVELLRVVVDLVAGTLSNLSIAITWRLKIGNVGGGQQQLLLTVPRNLA